MKGLLIYDRQRSLKNKWFIEKITAELSKLGIFLQTVYDGEFTIGAEIDFAVMRTENYMLSKELEQNGIRVFNNSEVTRICNNKALTYQYVSRFGIPVMPTFYGNDLSQISDFPKVIKPCGGHGGKNVFLVNNRTELEEAARQIKPDNFVIQDLADPGRDLRVYIIGNKIVTAMERTSKSDFRSNFSLGGKAKRRPLTPKEESTVRAVLEIFNFDFAGIDLIYRKGEPVLNEIEDIVGSRMVYAGTELDIIADYALHIAKTLSF